MIEVKEVKTAKQRKEFLNFPLKLYKGNPYFVPPLYGDEKIIFDTKKNMYYETCKASFFLAYKDGKVVGRISGIIQFQHIEKTGEKRARFVRFDAINDQEVANALFAAVENWAKENGITTVHGPLGFSDQEREGLLIEGFDQLSTFEEQYNYEYYGKLIENCGYQKEIDWVEYKIFTPKEVNPKIAKISERVLERHGLHIATGKNKNEFINRYKDGIFAVLDEAYSDLYGTVPFTEKMKEQLIGQFKLLLTLDYLIVVCDKDDKVVAFGLGLPSLSKAVQPSKGKLLPFGIFRILKAVKHPKIVDFALIGVTKEYMGKGLNSVILDRMINTMIKLGVEYAETNLNLETNDKIQAQWKIFEHEQHKRRRAYIKNLVD